jgi:hypothetical protein
MRSLGTEQSERTTTARPSVLLDALVGQLALTSYPLRLANHTPVAMPHPKPSANKPTVAAKEVSCQITIERPAASAKNMNATPMRPLLGFITQPPA